MSSELREERQRVLALGADVQAAQETIEVLIRRFERMQGPLQADQYALQKAVATLEDSLAASNRALRASEARLRTLFDTGPDLRVTVDAQARVVTANRVAARANRCRAVELSGRPLSELFDAPSGPALEQMAERGFEGVVERPLTLADGTPVAMTAAPLPGFAGETQLVLRDLTWRRVLEGELTHSRRHALVGHLAAIVGHEINNPLAVMLGRLELLLGTDLDDPELARRSLERLLEHGRRIARIVQQLQAVSQPMPVDSEILSVAEVVDAACDQAAPLLGRCVLRVDVTPPRLTVPGDRRQLEQLLVNLLINAAERMRRRGSIELRAEPETEAGVGAEAVVIAVADEGRVVAADLLENLLAPGLDPGVRRGGADLGLTIAQNIAQEHGGALRVINRDQGGVVFELTLPAVRPVRQEAAGLVDLHGLRLLCVHEDPLVFTGLESLLEDTGCRCRAALSGEDALDRMELEDFDLLLTAIQLPAMSGIELHHAVAGRDPLLAQRTIFIGVAAQNAPAGVPTLPRSFSRMQLLGALGRLLPRE